MIQDVSQPAKDNIKQWRRPAAPEGSDRKYASDIPSNELLKVLVLYTGGTIGMKDSHHGYVPEAGGYLHSVLTSLPPFHDLMYGDPRQELEANPTTRPDFVMPRSKYGKQVVYHIKEYDPLLDSCNMAPSDWQQIAANIATEIDDYDGFVVLHGTDTMAYTGSALSFLLEGLAKTVIVTGSQIPLSVPLSDGIANLLGALMVAAHYQIPEVLLYFNGSGFRANRCTKVHSSGLAAFDSPNLQPIVTIGVDTHVNWHLVHPPMDVDGKHSPLSSGWARLQGQSEVPSHTKPQRTLIRMATDSTPAGFRVHTGFEARLSVFHLFPGFSVQLLEHALQPPLHGLILRTYGAGNAPDGDPELLRILREAARRGVAVVNLSQCAGGAVTAHYSTGNALLRAGVIPGGDMTVEAGLTKLGYLLSKANEAVGGAASCQRRALSPAERVGWVRAMMRRGLRGELTEAHEAKFSFRPTLRSLRSFDERRVVEVLRESVQRLPRTSWSQSQQGHGSRISITLDDMQVRCAYPNETPPLPHSSSAAPTVVAAEVQTTPRKAQSPQQQQKKAEESQGEHPFPLMAMPLPLPLLYHLLLRLFRATLSVFLVIASHNDGIYEATPKDPAGPGQGQQGHLASRG